MAGGEVLWGRNPRLLSVRTYGAFHLFSLRDPSY